MPSVLREKLNRLLPNHILTPLPTHPNLMHPTRRDIDPSPEIESLLTRMLILRVRDGEGTAADEVGGQTAVGVRCVVCVSTLAEGGGG